jgi:hypothetical protein
MVDAAVDARLIPLSGGLRVELDNNQEKVKGLLVELDSLRVELDNNRGHFNARLDAMAVDVYALTRHLPIIMNTIASQNAMSRDQQRRIQSLESLPGTIEPVREGLAYLTERMEFVRKELLFEQRYRGESKDAGPAPDPKVLNMEKLKSMGDDIRVNVGSGHISVPDYLNVDARELPGIDVVADVHNLPFGVGELSEIFSAHLLEHFPLEDLRRKLLPYWVTLLKDGGKIVAVVPDIETMVVERAAGRMSFDDFREVTYGGQEYEGDFHFNGFSPDSLGAILTEVGLSDVTIRETGRRNGICYEMEVEATFTAEPTD